MNAEGGAAGRFLDTNVLLYTLSEDDAKAQVAEGLLAAGGIVSVQVRLHDPGGSDSRGMQCDLDRGHAGRSAGLGHADHPEPVRVQLEEQQAHRRWCGAFAGDGRGPSGDESVDHDVVGILVQHDQPVVGRI